MWGGVRVGFIGVSRVIPVASWTAGASSPGLLTAYDPGPAYSGPLRRTRPLCDYLVVLIHWGVEREEMPVDHQTSLGRQCINAGADLGGGKPIPTFFRGLSTTTENTSSTAWETLSSASSIPRTALLKVSLDQDGL